jgi:predicted XRE-type DNA-binding protein
VLLILEVLKNKTQATPKSVINACRVALLTTTRLARSCQMDKEKRAHLEAQGWKVGSAEEFLGLTPEEASYVDLRLKLSDAVRELRKKKHLTQVQLAERLQSSQSRVAKVEAGDESVSLDLLVRSLLALGATDQDLAEVITGKLAKAS